MYDTTLVSVVVAKVVVSLVVVVVGGTTVQFCATRVQASVLAYAATMTSMEALQYLHPPPIELQPVS
jgi:CBS-domain-containing membrane protein